MRFKNGSPKTLFVVTFQNDGEIVPFTSVTARKQYLTDLKPDYKSLAILATYDLREAK